MQADRVSVECVDQLAHRNSAASGQSGPAGTNTAAQLRPTPSSAAAGPPRHLAQYSGLHFKAEFDVESVSARRSFWDARFVPLALPRHAPDGSIQVEVPASFALESCTDISRPERPQSQRVLLGPLVFKVTSSSAVAMIELALSGPVELLCVDQLTGEEVGPSCPCIENPRH